MNTIKNERKIKREDIAKLLSRYQFDDEIIQTVNDENLLPTTLLQRLYDNFPQHAKFLRTDKQLFTEKNNYAGLKGFREIIAILNKNGIDIGHIKDREFFIEVYRFLATKHVLNAIDWTNYEKDSLYQLVFPQPGMINADDVEKYADAKTDEERKLVVEQYMHKTNPHDGKQKLNKPWFVDDDGHLEVLQGSQHKYPPIALIFDKQTQNCFSFCTYCFRHAQVRGDEDMFIQHDVKQVHDYLKNQKEVSDILITGGDAGYISYDRLVEYVAPILNDPELKHIKIIRMGSRALTFQPEIILTNKYKKILEFMRQIIDNGIQFVWVGHFSTPKEILNSVTVAAIRRLKSYGVTVKSQSPIMNHISMFEDENGKIDIDRSAQNWIDLGNILGMLGIGFHSMYCARPTGEHHYFTAPLIDIHRIFTKVYKSLSSFNRPSRYITMTSSAGKISLLGTAEVNGETIFALKFNEGRNMDWLDRVYLAKYDEKENTIEKLKPYDTPKHFYEDECTEIEDKLSEALESEMVKANQYDQ